jgi:ParB-like chromosome segregation protein Spo0J
MIGFGDLRANPWNPNRMDAAMYAKERASIREFGFIDPLTVRFMGNWWQIIDGEHRWRAGIDEGMIEFPCVVLEDITEDEAKELTIILTDTRGSMQEDRLSALVKDLAERRDAVRLATILPYDRGRMDSLLEKREIDWSELEKRRVQAKDETERWVERIYRMPVDAAGVVDEAIRKVREEEEIEQDWRALEFIAADFLA